MKEKLLKSINWVLGKNVNSDQSTPQDVNNTHIKLKQLKILVAVLLVAALSVGAATLFIKSKALKRSKQVVEDQVLTVELADKNLDPEKHWRNYFEDRQDQVAKDLEKRLQELSEAQAEVINKTNLRIEE